MTARSDTKCKRNISMDKNEHRTPGEELYLVHLKRFHNEEDDHDFLPRKRRSSSVGEELWEIHMKRSQGLDDDSDRDTEDSLLLDKRNFHKHRVIKVTSAPEKKSEKPKCRYNLRNRDSQITKKP